MILDPLAGVSLNDSTRTTFRSLCSDIDAHAEGNHIHSAVVLDELLRVASLSHPFVSASRVPGYGPMRLKGSRTLRRTAIRVLKSAAGTDAPALARIESAASEGGEKPDERARSLNALADELESVAAKFSPEIAADMGLSQGLISDLRANANAVLGARETARKSRGDIASHYDQMNILDGRILFELRALYRAMRDARKNDPSIPQVQKGRVQKSRKKGEPVPGDSTPVEPKPV